MDGSEGGDALGRQGRMLDVSRTIEKTQAVEYLPYLCDMAPDLDDRREPESIPRRTQCMAGVVAPRGVARRPWRRRRERPPGRLFDNPVDREVDP